jgi:hypothetical protein
LDNETKKETKVKNNSGEAGLDQGASFWQWGDADQDEPDPPEEQLETGRGSANRPAETQRLPQAECRAEVPEDPAEPDWVIDLELLYILQSVGELGKRVIPSLVKEWEWEWDRASYGPGYGLYDPSKLTRAEIAEEIASWLGCSLVDVLGALENTMNERQGLASRVQELSDQAKGVQEEKAALLERVERLKGVERPRCAQIAIPREVVTIRSQAQQEIVRLIGQEGLGRNWRIIARVVGEGLGQERSVNNAVNKLTKKGLVEDYHRDGKSIRWKCTTGGSRRLVVLTERGAAWYREAYGREPVESEILRAARQHRSAVHGVGVLEARDHLRAAGYRVDDDPEAILEQDGDRLGRRQEPDLVVWMDGGAWPVEVQREVSQRLLEKMEKALSLSERLVLILFNVEHRKKQEVLLRQDQRVRGLRRGAIYLTSLEEMETEGWKWTVLDLPLRY